MRGRFLTLLMCPHAPQTLIISCPCRVRNICIQSREFPHKGKSFNHSGKKRNPRSRCDCIPTLTLVARLLRNVFKNGADYSSRRSDPTKKRVCPGDNDNDTQVWELNCWITRQPYIFRKLTKRTIIWRRQRQLQKHTQRQIQRQRQWQIDYIKDLT